MSGATVTGEMALIAIDALDKLSRLRALDEIESRTLERLIRVQDSSEAGATRLAAWRARGLVHALHIPETAAILAERKRLKVCQHCGAIEGLKAAGEAMVDGQRVPSEAVAG